MKIYVIESGSRGNSTLIENKGRFLLLDMGISWTTLNDTLKSLDKNIYDVDALLLTHSHSDHTKGIQYLPPLPIYCTKDTYSSSSVNIIKTFEPFELNGLKITPVLISHDVPNPVGYIFEDGKKKFVYITDTGYIPEKTFKMIGNADYYVMESNHNLKMLYKCNRPQSLKERIASDLGHLSNEDAAAYMIDLVGPNTKEIILAHISQECNTYELAVETFEKKFRKAHIPLDKISIKAAKQKELVIGGDK